MQNLINSAIVFPHPAVVSADAVRRPPGPAERPGVGPPPLPVAGGRGALRPRHPGELHANHAWDDRGRGPSVRSTPSGWPSLLHYWNWVPFWVNCAQSGLITLTHYCLTGPFVPVLLKFRLTKSRDIRKNFLWASRLWVGRQKEPILGYVPKNYEKKESRQ